MEDTLPGRTLMLTQSCMSDTELHHVNNQQHVPTRTVSDGDVEDPMIRRVFQRGRLRHAVSEWIQTSNDADTTGSNNTMTEVREMALEHLQTELTSAHAELKVKDEECAKLLKVRDQIGEELEELTASLFEEANKMVIDANVKRMHAEKLLAEAKQQIEVLQAELKALKQLVITSTPSAPNKHLHPQIGNSESNNKDVTNDKDKSVPFWKTHRRATSHHQFTQEDRIKAEGASSVNTDRCKELDDVCFEEYKTWKQNVTLSRSSPFIAKIFIEDIITCLNFANTQMSEKVLGCVENNSLAIEPMSLEMPYFGKCQLSEVPKPCKYKVKLGDGPDWYCISEHCRNRIAAVCDFFTYVRYIQQGLVKSNDKDVFYEIVRLRKQMALARLGYV